MAPSAGTLGSDAKDVGSVTDDGDTGALQGAASRGRAARPIIAPPRPVRRCVVMSGDGDGGDGMNE